MTQLYSIWHSQTNMPVK